jgi:hypothetical protein
MVLEYLPGCSLDERLRDGGPLPWREVVQSATQVARALEVLHRPRGHSPRREARQHHAARQRGGAARRQAARPGHRQGPRLAAGAGRGLQGTAASPDRCWQGDRHTRILRRPKGATYPAGSPLRRVRARRDDLPAVHGGELPDLVQPPADAPGAAGLRGPARARRRGDGGDHRPARTIGSPPSRSCVSGSRRFGTAPREGAKLCAVRGVPSSCSR